MKPDLSKHPRSVSIRRHLTAGLAIVILFAGGVGGWATTTELSGAVVAPGVIVVDSSSKRVQHPTGGVIGELLVREGDAVTAGAVLIRLDQTQTRANLDIVNNSLYELYARQARLEAERDGLQTAPPVPPELREIADDPAVARVVSGERKLFELRVQSRGGEKAQLEERVAQLEEEIAGITAQATAKAREIELVQQELVGVRDLWEKKLIQLNRVTELERNAARLEGERALLVANRAQAKGRIAEIKLQIIQIVQTVRSEAGAELADVRAKISELVEREVAAEDQLRRVEIRAPLAGSVHQLAVHTVGGVIQPGETLMLIVPEAGDLTVEVRIHPREIDRIRLGQAAGLRFPAFNLRTTPELNGIVSRVSADVTEDAKSGAAFYTVRVAVSDAEMARLGSLRLLPGMPVEAFIRTDKRTVLSYFIKPMQDQLSRAFRER